jgi:flagellar biosynthesis GTPase FlhF
MELKRFVGDDSKATMDQVRAEFGEDALIISTNKIGNKTEMICAVEEPPAAAPVHHAAEADGEGLDISEATSTVASLLNRVAADNATATPGKRGNSKERIAQEFGKELTSALAGGQQGSSSHEPFVPASKRAPEPERQIHSDDLPPDSKAMHNMMQTIQADLARLRNQLEEQAAVQTPLRKAQLAMASINQRVQHKQPGSCRVAEQIDALVTRQLSAQRDWQGVHAFVGYPGAGKSTVIATLIQQTLHRGSATNTVVVSLQGAVSATTAQDGAPAILINNGLAQLCQQLGIIYLQAADLDQLGQLVTRYRDDHQVLIDTPAALLSDPVALATLVTENEILPHLCLAADAAPWIIDALAESTPWISASVLLTRFDLAGELEATLNALEARGAQISGVNGHLVDAPLEEIEKGNSPSTLEE